MNKRYRKRYLILLASVLCFIISTPVSIYAQEKTVTPYAYDVVNKSFTREFTRSLTCQSISPSMITASMLKNDQKKVSFGVELTGAIQYDRISNTYVSASSPTATLNYIGPVRLGLYNVSTSALDRGKYITFTCSATVKGVVEVAGVIATIDYGRVYYSFNQNK